MIATKTKSVGLSPSPSSARPHADVKFALPAKASDSESEDEKEEEEEKPRRPVRRNSGQRKTFNTTPLAQERAVRRTLSVSGKPLNLDLGGTLNRTKSTMGGQNSASSSPTNSPPASPPTSLPIPVTSGSTLTRTASSTHSSPLSSSEANRSGSFSSSGKGDTFRRLGMRFRSGTIHSGQESPLSSGASTPTGGNDAKDPKVELLESVTPRIHSDGETPRHPPLRPTSWIERAGTLRPLRDRWSEKEGGGVQKEKEEPPAGDGSIPVPDRPRSATLGSPRARPRSLTVAGLKAALEGVIGGEESSVVPAAAKTPDSPVVRRTRAGTMSQKNKGAILAVMAASLPDLVRTDVPGERNILDLSDTEADTLQSLAYNDTTDALAIAFKLPKTEKTKKKDDEKTGLVFEKDLNTVLENEQAAYNLPSPHYVPKLVTMCTQYFYDDTHAVACPGLFRLSGALKKVKDVMEQFDSCKPNINLSGYGPHEVSNTFKNFLRTMAEPLLTYRLYPVFMKTYSYRDTPSIQLSLLQRCVSMLPTPNRHTLWHLLNFLAYVATYEVVDENGEPINKTAPNPSTNDSPLPPPSDQPSIQLPPSPKPSCDNPPIETAAESPSTNQHPISQAQEEVLSTPTSTTPAVSIKTSAQVAQISGISPRLSDPKEAESRVPPDPQPSVPEIVAVAVPDPSTLPKPTTTETPSDEISTLTQTDTPPSPTSSAAPSSEISGVTQEGGSGGNTLEKPKEGEKKGNKMGVRNLALMFGPNILRNDKPGQKAPTYDKEESDTVTQIMEVLIVNRRVIFTLSKMTLARLNDTTSLANLLPPS